jgi:glycerol-1-phosphate dehydrogenase [NAD(P)+]
MQVNESLRRADPRDLEDLRRALSASDPTARLHPIGLRMIEIGDEVLDRLPETVLKMTNGRRITVLMDSTPMRRKDTDLKREALGLLAGNFDVTPVVLQTGNAELHADESTIKEAQHAVANADCVVTIGSGTITDISKEATKGGGAPPLVVLQTAASVNAFSDNLAVVLKNGVKRTVPSRWPDVLLIDLPTLKLAPPAMNLAGFGDLLSLWTAPADWYLAWLLGMDASYHPAPADMLLEQGRKLLENADALKRSEPQGLELLARVLTLSGIAMGVAGSTALLSGTEHLVSHLIDMEAGLAGRPLALHGAQVGVSAVVIAGAWEILLEEFDPGAVDLNRCFPDPDELAPLVRDAFVGIDPTGRAAEECWSDYSKKLARWRTCRPNVEAFLRDWTAHRSELRKITSPQSVLAAALREAGAPSRNCELRPPSPPEVARWALKNCHFMRNRFTIADLLFFLGWWNKDFIERLLKRAQSVGGGL